VDDDAGAPDARRVALVLGPSTGGIRRHVGELARRLPSLGWEVTTAGPAGVLDGLVDQDAVVEIPDGLAPGAVVRARRQLRDAVAGSDVVHAHGLKAGLLAATLRPRPRLVVTVHNLVLDDVAGRRAPLLRALEGALPRLADRVLAVSEVVAARFPRQDRVVATSAFAGPPVPSADRATVRRELGVPEDAPMAVTVARLHPQKGLLTLLAALTLVRERVPGVRAVLVGEGPMEAELREKARDLGLDEVVVFAGRTANSADQLAAADVVVIPSTWESGPLVLLEALQLGRPVVATPVGMVPEYVTDGESGRLVPVGDAAGLAGAVADVLADRAGSQALAEEGRRRVSKGLAVEQELARVVGVYQAVLRERP
jgi:glycosyltransferase involved in cell wall biosynthesis